CAQLRPDFLTHAPGTHGTRGRVVQKECHHLPQPARPLTRHTTELLPGFRAHDRPVKATHRLCFCHLKFYRDFEHRRGAGTASYATGISGTKVPGFRTRGSRELGHWPTGKWGTIFPARTGNRGTHSVCNPQSRLGKSAGNFVFLNPSKNSPTGGGGLLFL